MSPDGKESIKPHPDSNHLQGGLGYCGDLPCVKVEMCRSFQLAGLDGQTFRHTDRKIDRTAKHAPWEAKSKANLNGRETNEPKQVVVTAKLASFGGSEHTLIEFPHVSMDNHIRKVYIGREGCALYVPPPAFPFTKY